MTEKSASIIAGRGFCKCSHIFQSEMANGKIVPISQPYLSTGDYHLCKSEDESGYEAALQPIQLSPSVERTHEDGLH